MKPNCQKIKLVVFVLILLAAFSQYSWAKDDLGGSYDNPSINYDYDKFGSYDNDPSIEYDRFGVNDNDPRWRGWKTEPVPNELDKKGKTLPPKVGGTTNDTPKRDWRDQSTMTIILNLLMHFLIILALLTLLGSVLLMIGIRLPTSFSDLQTADDQSSDRYIRVLAVAMGVLIYIGSKGVGLSIPGLIMHGMQLTNPIVFGAAGVVFPSLAGVLIAWYFIRQMKKSEILARRIMIMLMVFILIMFGDVYAASYSASKDSAGINTALLPNLFFVVGMGLYTVLQYEGSKKD